jgi:hypothetical protein
MIQDVTHEFNERVGNRSDRRDAPIDRNRPWNLGRRGTGQRSRRIKPHVRGKSSRNERNPTDENDFKSERVNVRDRIVRGVQRVVRSILKTEQILRHKTVYEWVVIARSVETESRSVILAPSEPEPIRVR